MTRMRRFGSEDKPEKKRRTSADRFAWHACWHNDAWIGVDELSGLATGIYWKVILRMYIRRAAMPDDDAANARLFNETIKNYRRAKAELLAANRIVVDNGLLFDERAMRELVAAERFSEEQQERAQKRWATKAAKASRVEGSNIVALSPETAESLREHARVVHREVPHEVSANSITKSVRSRRQPATYSEHNQGGGLGISVCRMHATQTQTHIEANPQPETRSPSAAQPPRGGGARAPLRQMSVAERTAEIERFRAALEVEKEGKDDESDGGSGATIGASKAVRKKRLPGVGN